MPKIKLRRLVAVFAHGQSFRTTPLCYIPREDAEWWVNSGGAELPKGYSGRIVLNKLKSLEIRGASAKMGPAVLEAVSQGSRFHAELLRRWRFGFIETEEAQPKPRKEQRTPSGVRALYFAAPECAEA